MDLKTLNGILAFELEDFPEYYVGNDGNIYSEKWGRMHRLKDGLGRGGYYSVHLYKNGIGYTKDVHRLIAETFIPNPKGFRCVDHKNGIKTDNSLANLRWVDHRDNNRNNEFGVRKNNSSGIQGVSFYRSNSWRAYWCDNDNKLRSKTFSLKKHGDKAKTLAIAYRKKMVDKFYNRP